MSSLPPETVSETRPLPASVRVVYLDAPIDVVIRQGVEPCLTVECSDREFLPKVLTSVSENRLTIDIDPVMIIQGKGGITTFKGPVGMVIRSDVISRGQVCIGNGNVQIGINQGVVIKTDDGWQHIAKVTVVLPGVSDLHLSGSGNIAYQDLQQNEITADISGSGRIELSGMVSSMEVDISGSGQVIAYDLEATTAKLRISGSGKIRSTVTASVRARISGSGKIKIAGNPLQRDTDVSGSGTNKICRQINAMKALSVRQPWAFLLVNGFKDIENRTWSTKHRGPFLIHAGQSFDHAGYVCVRQRFPNIKMPAVGEFELGGIVGQADLVDCLPPDSHLAGRCNSPWYEGEYGFMVANAKPLPFKPMKGKLHFFEVPDA